MYKAEEISFLVVVCETCGGLDFARLLFLIKRSNSLPSCPTRHAHSRPTHTHLGRLQKPAFLFFYTFFPQLYYHYNYNDHNYYLEAVITSAPHIASELFPVYEFLQFIIIYNSD